MIKEKNKFSNQRGSVILWTIMFTALFLLVVSTVATTTVLEIRQSAKIDNSTAAYLLAEAGAERAKEVIHNDLTFFAIASPPDYATYGFIGGNKYTFQIAKGGPVSQYDYPPRDCNVDPDGNLATKYYCYYSEGEVGRIKRKIEGLVEEISADKEKSVDLRTDDFTLDSAFIKAFDMKPLVDPTGNILSYSVDIEGMDTASDEVWQLGIFDNNSSYSLPSPYDADEPPAKLGFLINAQVDNLQRRIFTVDLMAVNELGNKINFKDRAISITVDNDTYITKKYRLALTFRKENTDLSRNSLTLKVTEIVPNGDYEHKICVGTKTFTNDASFEDVGNISPFYAFFYGSNIAPSGTVFEENESNVRLGRIKRTENDSVSRFYSALYLRVE